MAYPDNIAELKIRIKNIVYKTPEGSQYTNAETSLPNRYQKWVLIYLLENYTADQLKNNQTWVDFIDNPSTWNDVVEASQQYSETPEYANVYNNHYDGDVETYSSWYEQTIIQRDRIFGDSFRIGKQSLGAGF